jgi:uncharacterized protein YgfB (UPF0149 family)
MLKLSYHSVDDVLLTNEASVGAAEAHGILAGLLCSEASVDVEQWLSLLFDETEGGDLIELSESEQATLHELYDETVRLMGAVDFSFQLFLPDDDAPLSERAEALSDWCQGFLYGVGQAGDGSDWPDDCAEVLRDLADISRLDSNASGEEDEAAYTEISEFVRVAVQLVRGDLRPPASVKSRLH